MINSNLTIFCFIQISKNLIYASPIQLKIDEEIVVENDIKFETEYKNLDYGEETDEIEDDEEEHNRIEARVSNLYFSDIFNFKPKKKKKKSQIQNISKLDILDKLNSNYRKYRVILVSNR